MYRDLVRAAEAGELSPIGWDAIEYLASQLPDGYVLDEHNHVIRTDPDLPDHFITLSCERCPLRRVPGFRPPVAAPPGGGPNPSR